MSEAERESGMNGLRAFVVVLVAGSGALVALYADAPVEFVLAGAVGGALVGLVLWYYLVWTYKDGTSRQEDTDSTEYEKRERFK
jgi:NhaP-type Na+/H+ or K+/H+ antiporter